jgi:hypothetical protein
VQYDRFNDLIEGKPDLAYQFQDHADNGELEEALACRGQLNQSMEEAADLLNRFKDSSKVVFDLEIDLIIATLRPKAGRYPARWFDEIFASFMVKGAPYFAVRAPFREEELDQFILELKVQAVWYSLLSYDTSLRERAKVVLDEIWPAA